MLNLYVEDVDGWRGNAPFHLTSSARSQAAKLRSWTKAKLFAGSAAIQTGNVLGNAFESRN